MLDKIPAKTQPHRKRWGFFMSIYKNARARTYGRRIYGRDNRRIYGRVISRSNMGGKLFCQSIWADYEWQVSYMGGISRVWNVYNIRNWQGFAVFYRLWISLTWGTRYGSILASRLRDLLIFYILYMGSGWQRFITSGCNMLVGTNHILQLSCSYNLLTVTSNGVKQPTNNTQLAEAPRPEGRCGGERKDCNPYSKYPMDGTYGIAVMTAPQSGWKADWTHLKLTHW